MEKMRMETLDMVSENIKKIENLFPNCITETVDENGKPKKAINFELLRQMLSSDVIEGNEAYEFTWVGKKAAIVEANKPIRKTLRPCLEESVNWDKTENLYIEGDNLEVLKLLQESYLGKVKMIYIDPPYNTGNDFIYRDDFKMDQDDYDEQTGNIGEEGEHLFKNSDSNGRFHSDWCSMLFARLMIARNILSENGVIFVSIDEHEVDNCLKILDEVFGRTNRVGVIIIKSNPRGSMSIGELANLHEYLIVYCKEALNGKIIGHKLTESMTDEYKFKDEFGSYRLLGLRMRGGFWRRSERPNLYFPIFINPKTGLISLEHNKTYTEKALPVQPTTMEDGTWRWSKEKVESNYQLLLGKKVNRNGKDVWDVFQKDYLEREGERRTKAKSIWEDAEINYQNGTAEIKSLFRCSVFDYSKPVFLLKKAIEMVGMDNDDIVMDFFSGSATTAHAVIQQNVEDGIKRKFIMVQLPERCDENSDAFKAGFNNICEIGKERIRRAGAKIKEEKPLITQDLDVGFRVFKLDDSNMNDVYYSANEYKQDMLSLMESNVKEDRADLDLLFGCLLEWGLPLSLPYTSEKIENCTVHTYNDGDLIACFDENVPESVIKTIAKRKPLRAVFRDSSFESSPSKINLTEIFKMLAPDTRVKVI
ncbi:MAG: site-specific DNA-methyltransferase [Acidaminococcaceae bacterium]|nr:site-specific DNA-methyltransferase [Acidaminococcaceae bacterium]